MNTMTVAHLNVSGESIPLKSSFTWDYGLTWDYILAKPRKVGLLM